MQLGSLGLHSPLTLAVQHKGQIMMSFKKQALFLDSFGKINPPILFVHSNSMETLPLIKVSASKDAILNAHIELLHKIVNIDKLLVPTFNYQFPKDRVFDVEKTPSEVGQISEFYRDKYASWRNYDPMFSVSGAGRSLVKESEIQCPFDDDSIFSFLVDNDAYILFYGTKMNTATMIHHVEYKVGVQYRYWKSFEGILNNRNGSSKLVLYSHFRAMGRHLDYDWPRLESDLEQEGLIQHHFKTVFGCKAKSLVDFWMSKLSDDPFYLLDPESRTWVMPMLESLGRGFLQSDFEGSL